MMSSMTSSSVHAATWPRCIAGKGIKVVYHRARATHHLAIDLAIGERVEGPVDRPDAAAG
jgi:hypothetical protein